MSKSEMTVYRQGDVLIVRTKEIPDDAKQIKREKGALILAYGEVTGHSHTISDKGVKVYESPTMPEIRWIVSDVPFTVQHQEHAPITIPAGLYEQYIQTEYVAGEIKRVID